MIHISSEDKIQQYYNECWIARFEKGHNPLSKAMHMGFFESGDEDNDVAKLKMNQYALQLLEIKESAPVVIADAGCGIGGTIKYIIDNYPLAKAIGINFSARQLEFAEAVTLADLDKTRFSLQCENYSSTSILSDSVDYVIAIESMCHADSKPDFLKEMRRILKPGGCLLIVDYIQTTKPMSEVIAEQLKSFEEGWAVTSYFTSAKDAIADAGFVMIKDISIVHHVKPGIVKSSLKSANIQSEKNGSLSTILQKHTSACIALEKLVDEKVIDYRAILVQKPHK
jgi:cyclopropane fatty-acyl-phospholipid synthase-like methyltransferase